MDLRSIVLRGTAALLLGLGASGCGGGSGGGSDAGPPVPTEPDPSIGIEFLKIEAGTFSMGDRLNEGAGDEFPVHTVTISQPFYLGKYEVTQAQWKQWMGDNPSLTACDTCPVDSVSWDRVQEFLATLNGAGTGGRFRLPTEAEWEYAARSGDLPDRYAGTSDEAKLPDYAWFDVNSGDPARPQPVGQKLPNAWGFHDMSGNVDEWVQDWNGPYGDGAVTDPQGPATGEQKVHRGGNACDRDFVSRVANRESHLPTDVGLDWVGFRVAWVPN